MIHHPSRRHTRWIARGPWLVAPATVAALCAAAVLLGSPRVSAPAPAGSQSQATQPPVFRSSVRLIDVDVFVTDQQGRPIKGLSQDSFELLEDGKPQEVRAFTAIDLPVTSPESSVSDLRTAGGPDPDVVTNTDTGRLYVILLDSPFVQFPENSGLQQFRGRIAYDDAAKRVASEFIQEALAPRDQAAIINVQGPRTASQGLTGNRQLLQAAIDKYGQGLSGASSAPESCQPTPEIVTRVLDSYRAMSDVSERLGTLSGRRKTIIWIGGQLPYTSAFPGTCDPPVPLTVAQILDRQWPTIVQARRDAMRVATRNNVAIFPVDPAGLTTDLGQYEIERLSALREVAEDTGGSAVVGTNNFAGGFSRIMQENSTYYVLGYSPADEYRDGKFHSIRVRVKQRPELVVHARRGFTAPDADAKPAALPPLPDGVSIAARDALRSPAPVSGVGIDLSTAVFRDSATEGSVVLDAQIRGAGLQLDASARVTISYQVIDLDGKIVTGAYKGFTLDFRDSSRQQIMREGLRFVDRISLTPGRYEVRFVADQPDSDVLGSVITHVEIPDTGRSLSMSGILLASASTEDHKVLYSDEKTRTRLSADPTTARRFPQGDELAVYVELYGDNVRGADEARVTVSVIRSDGKALVTEDGVEADVDPDAGIGKGFRTLLSLSDVPPGAYILRVEGHATGTRDPITRELPFTVLAD